MKLNNKGFAFSTVLYGTLAIIILVLYVILAISQSSSDTTYYYGEAIESKLNECVYEEIALENCYSSGSGTCDATAYRGCLGISKNDLSSGTIISETLKAKVVSSGDGLYLDPYVENKYIYMGTNPNNYIQYGGKTWRIVNIEQDGSVKIIDYSSNINQKWDSNSQDNWNNSTLKMYLNNEYYMTLVDKSKLISGKWQATYVYPSKGTGGLSISELVLQDEEQDSTSASFSQVGILTISDYMKATTVQNCKNNMLTATGCTSWLSNYKGWTLNIDGEQYSSSIAYFLDSEDKISEDNTGTSHRVYPVIVLNRTVEIEKGTGTSTDPYVLK